MLGGSTRNRLKILESLLQPSREIGPLYVPWLITTKDGRVLSGIKLHTPGAKGKTRYQSNNDLKEIEEQKMVQQSIMPNGLVAALDDQEPADLLALLESASK